MRKERGPRKAPCGTPHLTTTRQKLNLFIKTNCFLLFKSETNNLLILKSLFEVNKDSKSIPQSINFISYFINKLIRTLIVVYFCRNPN